MIGFWSGHFKNRKCGILLLFGEVQQMLDAPGSRTLCPETRGTFVEARSNDVDQYYTTLTR